MSAARVPPPGAEDLCRALESAGWPALTSPEARLEAWEQLGELEDDQDDEEDADAAAPATP